MKWVPNLLKQWYRYERLPQVIPDPGLFKVARANSLALAELEPSGAGAAKPSHGVSSYLHFLLEKHQVMDAVVQAFAARSRSKAQLKKELRAFLKERATMGELTHYGLGVAGSASGGNVLTLILVRRRVKVTAVSAHPGQPMRVCARILSGKQPRVVVTTPDDAILQRTPVLPGPRFCVRFPKGQKGIYRLEVMVDGRLGPEVAVLYTLYVGVPRPSLPVQKIYPHQEVRRQEVETKLFQWLNRSRRRAGLRALEPHRKLARIARTHSLDMVRSGFFGHHAPTRGNLTQRLKAARLTYLGQASENLALSTEPGRAHDSLMSSPTHRRNILDPKVTHVGIGAAFDAQRSLLYITQCFARLTY